MEYDHHGVVVAGVAVVVLSSHSIFKACNYNF